MLAAKLLVLRPTCTSSYERLKWRMRSLFSCRQRRAEVKVSSARPPLGPAHTWIIGDSAGCKRHFMTAMHVKEGRKKPPVVFGLKLCNDHNARYKWRTRHRPRPTDTVVTNLTASSMQTTVVVR